MWSPTSFVSRYPWKKVLAGLYWSVEKRYLIILTDLQNGAEPLRMKEDSGISGRKNFVLPSAVDPDNYRSYLYPN
jgi:hypothetical protein